MQTSTGKQVGVYPTLKQAKERASLLDRKLLSDTAYPYDENELLARAKNAFVRAGGDIPSVASEVVTDAGHIYVHLMNVNGTLAIYRYYPRTDRIRRIHMASLEALLLSFVGVLTPSAK
jgi:hypothetical protein